MEIDALVICRRPSCRGGNAQCQSCDSGGESKLWVLRDQFLAAAGMLNVNPPTAAENQNSRFCATNSGLDTRECIFDNLSQCRQDLGGGASWCELNKSLQGRSAAEINE
jgi:hypothetical protein